MSSSRLLPALIAMVAITAGCASDGTTDEAGEPAAVETTTDGSVDENVPAGSTSAVESQIITEDSDDLDDEEAGSTIPPTSAPSTAPSVDAPAVSTPFRLATAGPGVGNVIQWTASSAQAIGDTGSIDATFDDDFVELADLGELGIVFQRSDDEPAIWFRDGAGDRALIRGTDDQYFVLEGAGRDDEGNVVVWYQRGEPGAPADTITTLRAFAVETGEVTELAITGGWEYATDFSAIRGGETLARWGTHAEDGVNVIDLDTTGTPFGGGSQPECFDGKPDCAIYAAATLDGSVAYGVRFVFNAEETVFDRGGLFEFDPVSGDEAPLVAFGWETGLWYPDDIFVMGDLIIVSLRDGDDQPLPALVYDRSTGGFWTMPDPVFVRPRLGEEPAER